jgi:arylformamidase
MIRVSYPLKRDSPLYPGTPTLKITPDKSINQGDSSNTSIFTFSSHSTTHIDVPRHFCPNGYSVSDLPNDELVFFPAYCFDIPKSDDECICISDISNVSPLTLDAEALLIKTGFSQYRDCDNDRYSHHHPWVHPDLPDYLKKVFPNLKLVCFDILSISVPTHRQEGRQSHRAFLCGDPFILLMEDADLSDPRLLHKRHHLRIYPWLFEDTDGVPVVAFVTDE